MPKNGLNKQDVNKFLAMCFDEAVNNTSAYLAEYAQDKLREAMDTRTFMHDTRNLYDSYIWIVYYNGRIDDYGFIEHNELADEPNYGLYGRDEADNFLRWYKPQSRGWEVVLAATMFYGLNLEKGYTYSGRSFRVISQIFDELTSDFGSVKVIEKEYDPNERS